MRPSGRAPDAMRPVSLEDRGSPNTPRLVSSPIQQRPCPVRDLGLGAGATVSAQHRQRLGHRGIRHTAALDRDPHRSPRRRAAGRAGRTQEIQRLIGRSLRAVTDLTRLGERQIRIDCDVLQADGGTVTAAITGSYVALHQALQRLVGVGQLAAPALADSVAAVSCGVVAGRAVLDLDYAEDSPAMTDANFVLTGGGGIVEIQATAEGAPFDDALFAEMLRLARAGIADLTRRQSAALGLGST